ncbi:MAG: hypothetical protein JW955_11100 [Sedimentisphaerales bacterium]|nr:hypothetical protein [Sedimentisphaerales bacterium]
MLPDRLRIELQQKWEQLMVRLGVPTARRWINEYPMVVSSLAAASAMLLLAVALWTLIPDTPMPIITIEEEWYYDLNTGKLFTAEKGLDPPIDAPSGPMSDGGPAGVRAYVLSYVREPNESERFIAFLETTAPADMLAKWPRRSDSRSAARRWGRGKLIRKVDDELWIPADSKLGLQLMEEAFAPNKEGVRPTYCRPE